MVNPLERVEIEMNIAYKTTWFDFFLNGLHTNPQVTFALSQPC